MKVSSDYNSVFDYAQDFANKTGMDVGIEKTKEFGKVVYSAKFLPKPENRCGWELSCEVVRPNNK